MRQEGPSLCNYCTPNTRSFYNDHEPARRAVNLQVVSYELQAGCAMLAPPSRPLERSGFGRQNGHGHGPAGSVDTGLPPEGAGGSVSNRH